MRSKIFLFKTEVYGVFEDFELNRYSMVEALLDCILNNIDPIKEFNYLSKKPSSDLQYSHVLRDSMSYLYEDIGAGGVYDSDEDEEFRFQDSLNYKKYS